MSHLFQRGLQILDFFAIKETTHSQSRSTGCDRVPGDIDPAGSLCGMKRAGILVTQIDNPVKAGGTAVAFAHQEIGAEIQSLEVNVVVGKNQ